MGTSVGVGFSTQRNSAEAGKEAGQKALSQAGINKPDFVFAFATVGYDQQTLIRSIRETTGGAPLAGCSGEGVITQDCITESNFGVCVMAISSDELRFHHVCVKDITNNRDHGALMAAGIKPYLGPDNIACFLMPDGLAFNFDSFLTTFEKTLGHNQPLPIFGGLAADNWMYNKTYQYHNDDVFSEGISCVLMSGRARIAWGINHGCVPVGIKRTITRSAGNIIYEIDGIPSLEILRDYSDADWNCQWNKTSLNLCLAFKPPTHLQNDYGKEMIRYMIQKNDKDRSVVIQSNVQTGTNLWIARRDKTLIKDGMQIISREIKDMLGGRKPKFILHFECVGRGKVILREQEKNELVQNLQKDIGKDVPWLGFYTYGEIAPIADINCFHNFTAVITAIY